MGANQGVLRLNQGITRELTNSERARGYLFISNDQQIKGMENLNIFINNEKIDKKVDNFGRIGAGMTIINQIGKKSLTLKLNRDNLHITF